MTKHLTPLFHRACTLLVFAALLLAAMPTLAQVGQATLTGTVEDATQAIIPGATITLIDTTNQTHRQSKSDGHGFFSFPNLPAATYEIRIDAPGFNPFVRKNVVVHIADQLDVPQIRMALKSVSQTVTVTAQSEDIVPTTSGEASYTISANQIQNLNIEGRSAIELLELVPGAANSGNFNGDAYSGQTAGFSQNASAFSVNGNRFDQTQIVSDGATVTDVNTAGAAAVTPNIEMVQEAKVQTAAYSSEEPNGPVTVQTETKSGGKNYHGEVYTSIRNNALDDTDWRVKNLNLQKPGDAYYYPGFNIGGPVLIPGTGFNHNRDKLFFFAGVEKDLQYVQDPLLDIRRAVTPTAQERTGDFTDAAYRANFTNTAFFASTAPCAQPYNNQSLCLGTGVVNPAAIDPNGRVLLNALPLPNADPSVTGGYNLITNVVNFQPRDQEDLKLDYNISDRNHFSARYNHESEKVPFPFGYFNNFTPNAYPAEQIDHDSSHSVVANLSTTFSSTLTNQLIVSYTRLSFYTDLENEQRVSRSALGYNQPDLYNNGTDIIPNVQFQYGNQGYASLYLRGGSYPPTDAPQQIYVINDRIAKIYGNHLFKAGVYYDHQQFGQLTQGNENGTIQTGDYFGGTFGQPGYYASYNTGNDFADLLTGQIVAYSQSTKNFLAHMREKRFDFFAQDQWKVTSRFNFNYGVRVDHIGAWTEDEGRIVVFDPSQYNASDTYAQAPGLVTHATDSAIPTSGSKPRGFVAAPSLGFAYDVRGTGATIFRGGVGTNYYIDPGSNAFSQVQAPPNETFTSVQVNAGTPLTAIPTLQTYLPLGAYGIGDKNDHHIPVTYSYNLALSQSVPGNVRMELAYTGNASRNLTGYTFTNAVPEGCAQELASDPVNGGYPPTSFSDTHCRQYSLLPSLSTLTHNLSSYYNSLQLTASKATGWVNFWGAYTYGKTLAYNCEDPFDEKRCYNVAPFDRSQNLTVSYFIHLPGVSAHFNGNRVVGAFLDNWAISGIEQFSTGTPLEFSGNPGGNEYDGIHNRTINFYGSANFDPRVIVGTPDETAVPTLTCNPLSGLHAHQYFNAACFQAPTAFTTPGQPSIGTYRLPYIHGPRFEDDTIGLFKSLKFTETRNLELRAQAFNFTNHASDAFVQYDPGLYLGFGGYGSTATNQTQAGYASSKIGHRTIQLAAKFFF